jgi:hypothetical protein
MEKWKINDRCYFIENGWKIVYGVITAVRGGFCTVKYTDHAATRLRSTKLYRTEEEARQQIKPMPPRNRNPYDYI